MVVGSRLLVILMRFQVPQFINIEDKIFGPFTIKQFVYMVGGGGMVFIAWHFLPIWASIFIIAPVVALAFSLAFVKPSGKPFIFTLQAAISYALSSRLYLWKKRPKKVTAKEVSNEIKGGATVPTLSESKLKDLTWALDINQNVKKK